MSRLLQKDRNKARHISTPVMLGVTLLSRLVLFIEHVILVQITVQVME